MSNISGVRPETRIYQGRRQRKVLSDISNREEVQPHGQLISYFPRLFLIPNSGPGVDE